MVVYGVGKQGLETCENLFEKVFSRVKLPFPDNKIQNFSNGNDDYKTTIPEYYAETCVDYGQVIKIKAGGKVVDNFSTVKWVFLTKSENFKAKKYTFSSRKSGNCQNWVLLPLISISHQSKQSFLIFCKIGLY